MKDFVIASLASQLAASKNRERRGNIIALFKTLASFLQDNGLSVRPLLSPDQTPETEFRILRSDLTDEGYELMQTALHKWIGGITTGKSLPTDSTVLKKELHRLRQTE